MEPKKVSILGVSVISEDKANVYGRIEKMLEVRNNARIFTPNAEILYTASRDNEYKDLLSSADMLIPDGIGINLASRLLGCPLPERLTGIDTARHILDISADKELSVFLLGGKDGVAEKAATALREDITGLRVCGTHHGYFCKDIDCAENLEVREKIKNAEADLLFVCFGAPHQERWIVENTPYIPSLRLSMGLGGCFDVWSGNKKRAPLPFRKAGLEWLYRIASEPERIARLPRLAGFFSECLKSSL